MTGFFNPLRLTGAIFDKELRVAGRRRRNYVLRCLYVTVFMAFVALVWHAVMPLMSTGVVRSSQMWQAGVAIIMVIVWFQFIASQFVTIVMLSTAISDEIYHKTLGLLMTTPISSFQIVLGKLAGRLLQIVLLLAISLPMLAVVRVFGGIPWDLLLRAVSLTVATVIFYGALALFLSIFSRRSYAVIIEAIVIAAVLFVLLPVLILLGLHQIVPRPMLEDSISVLNPYVMMLQATRGQASPGSRLPVLWLYQCVASLSASTLLVILSTIFVRRAALRQVAGQEGTLFWRRRSRRPPWETPVPIRRVVGSPVCWRERRTPLFAGTVRGKVILGAGAAGLLALVYGLCGYQGVLADKDTQVGFVFVYTVIGILAAAVLPATCITSEKESRAWPILLTTPLSDRDIIWGKFQGAIRRCVVAWAPLFGHLAVFTLMGTVRGLAIFHLAIVATWVTLLLCGTGLYFSARFNRTTAAVIGNLGLAACLWVAFPVLGVLCLMTTNQGEHPFDLYMDTHPVVQAEVVMMATVGRYIATYDWPSRDHGDSIATAYWLFLNLAAYSGIGLAFLWRGWARLRRNPFG